MPAVGSFFRSAFVFPEDKRSSTLQTMHRMGPAQTPVAFGFSYCNMGAKGCGMGLGGGKEKRSVTDLGLYLGSHFSGTVPRQGLASWPVNCPVGITVGPQVSPFPPEFAPRGQKP